MYVCMYVLQGCVHACLICVLAQSGVVLPLTGIGMMGLPQEEQDGVNNL